MRKGSPGLLLLGLLVLGLLGCSQESTNAVLSGACTPPETHCVNDDTIQYCQDAEWGEPEACPPDLVGEPPLQVEIITYCGDGACRPAG